MARSIRTRLDDLERRVNARDGGVLALILDCIADMPVEEREEEIRRYGHLTIEALIRLSFGQPMAPTKKARRAS